MLCVGDVVDATERIDRSIDRSACSRLRTRHAYRATRRGFWCAKSEQRAHNNNTHTHAHSQNPSLSACRARARVHLYVFAPVCMLTDLVFFDVALQRFVCVNVRSSAQSRDDTFEHATTSTSTIRQLQADAGCSVDVLTRRVARLDVSRACTQSLVVRVVVARYRSGSNVAYACVRSLMDGFDARCVFIVLIGLLDPLTEV